jgi:hypothetical protein
VVKQGTDVRTPFCGKPMEDRAEADALVAVMSTDDEGGGRGQSGASM